MKWTILLFCCAFRLWPSDVAGVILCDETCASPDRGNASVCIQEKDSRQEILLLGLFPCNSPDFMARGLTVAAQMAVRQISYNDSQRDRLLQGYRLKLAVENTQCASLPAVRAFINNLDPQMNRTVHMVLGPGCSSGAMVVAPLANAWNLTTISFTASSPSFSDKAVFPNFIRTISSDIEAVISQAALITQYGWKQVALLTQFSPLFTALQEEQVRKFSALDIIVYQFQLSQVETVERGVADILASGARVVILNTFEKFARNIFCEMYKQNNANLNSFVWVVYGWYTMTWTEADLPADCTREMFYAAFNRTLAVHHYPLPSGEEAVSATDVAYTPNDFWAAFEAEITDLNYSPTDAIDQGRYVYDAVWLAAFMFDRGLKRLEREHGTLLKDIDYSNRNFTQILLSESRNISFRGVSGMVTLNDNGDRDPSFRIAQWRVLNGSAAMYTFASLSEDGRQLVYVNNESEATVWPDGVLRDFEENFVDLWLWIVAFILSIGGIGFAIVCIVFDLLFSKKRLVKVTSPYLNVVIDCGIILIFLTVISLGTGGQAFLTVPTASAFCMLNIWLAAIAFTLVFSPLFAKTFRVYWIFSRSKKMAKAKPFKDWILFIMVAVTLALDVVYLTFVTAFDSSRLAVDTQLLQRSDGLVPSQIRICTAEQSNAWIAILLVLKGIFLLGGVFLAVQTWNIKLKSINDSQLIAVSIVAVFFAAIVAALVAFFLRNQVDFAYGVTAACGILVGYLLLGLLYLKKMHSLRLHPDGVLETNLTTPTEVSLASVPTQGSSEKVTQVKNEVESLRKQVETLRKRAGIEASEPTVVVSSSTATPTPSQVSFGVTTKSTIELVPIH